MVTVYMPGHDDKQFKGKNIAGRIVVDSQVLLDAYGDIDVRHKAGDSFYSRDDTAIAFALAYNEQSIKEKVEYASMIYINPRGGYSFTYRTKGYEGKVAVPKGMPKRISTDYVHSHANYDSHYSNDMFSPDDVVTAVEKGIPIYLITPKGVLQKYDPKKDDFYIIATNLPYDPNHPDKKWKR